MNFINGLKSLKGNQQSCVATIGNFDGLHTGHQAIITDLRAKAESFNLPLSVISFEPLPAEYFIAEPPPRIYPLRDKVKCMSALNVDNFLCLKFNSELANTPPQQFIEKILIDSLKVKYLAVGDDFRFGYKREGGFNLLQEVGNANGMQVVDTETQLQNDERISSTRIREALSNGDLQTANNLLGRNYQLSGRVRHGDKKGRTIGFPTMNLKITKNIALKYGVYAVRIHGLGGDAKLGVANVGMRPTVNGQENRIETHVFNFSDNAYGKYVSIEFIEFIRSEKKFNSFNELKNKIKTDTKKAQAIFEV